MTIAQFYIALKNASSLNVTFQLVPGGAEYCIIDTDCFGPIMGVKAQNGEDNPVYRIPSFDNFMGPTRIENDLKMLAVYQGEKYTGEIFVK